MWVLSTESRLFIQSLAVSLLRKKQAGLFSLWTAMLGNNFTAPSSHQTAYLPVSQPQPTVRSHDTTVPFFKKQYSLCH